MVTPALPAPTVPSFVSVALSVGGFDVRHGAHEVKGAFRGITLNEAPDGT